MPSLVVVVVVAAVAPSSTLLKPCGGGHRPAELRALSSPRRSERMRNTRTKIKIIFNENNPTNEQSFSSAWWKRRSRRRRSFVTLLCSSTHLSMVSCLRRRSSVHSPWRTTIQRPDRSLCRRRRESLSASQPHTELARAIVHPPFFLWRSHRISPNLCSPHPIQQNLDCWPQRRTTAAAAVVHHNSTMGRRRRTTMQTK